MAQDSKRKRRLAFTEKEEKLILAFVHMFAGRILLRKRAYLVDGTIVVIEQLPQARRRAVEISYGKSGGKRARSFYQ